jgi:hypothetical protein
VARKYSQISPIFFPAFFPRWRSCFCEKVKPWGLLGKACRATILRRVDRETVRNIRDDHGEKPIGAMPPKFIALMLSSMKPHAARNYFKAIRALCQFAVSVETIESDPDAGH